MADQALIGRILGEFTLPVEAGKVREFARAIGAEDRIFFDPAAAELEGYPGIPAPLTFSSVASHFRDDGVDLLKELDLDLARVLHGGQSWRYHRVCRAGEVLRATVRVCDVRTKSGRRGGDMTFIDIETAYRATPDDDLVWTEVKTLIEMPPSAEEESA